MSAPVCASAMVRLMGKKRKPQTNPRKIPKTQADVDRAREAGIVEGSRCAQVIMMSALLDKFNAADYITEVWAAFEKLSLAVIEHQVTVPDLRTVLREEYGLDI